MRVSTWGSVLLGDHCEEEISRDGIGSRPDFSECPFDPFGLDLCQFVGQSRAFRRQAEAPFAAILVSGLLDDEAFIDELLQNARQRLLRYLQNVEQFRDLQAGIAVHEVQDAVVGAAKAVLLEYGVRIAGEAAVSEIEKLDTGNEIGTFGAAALVRDKGLVSRCGAAVRRTF